MYSGAFLASLLYALIISGALAVESILFHINRYPGTRYLFVWRLSLLLCGNRTRYAVGNTIAFLGSLTTTDRSCELAQLKSPTSY